MEWIKCSERLPKHEQNVIIYDKNGDIWYDVMFTNYEEDEQPSFYFEPTDNIIMLDEVTYWMPLLEPPKEAENE